MKTCSKCKQTKSFDLFHVDNSKPSGRATRCKECANQRKASLYSNLSPEARERERIRKKQWKKDNPEVVSAINKRTWAKRKNVLVEATTKETRDFMDANKVCVRCRSTENLTLDHIIPMSWVILSRHALDNFQVLCNECNASKNNHVSFDLRAVEECQEFSLFDLL